MRRVLLRFADDAIAEDDPHFAVLTRTRDRLQTGLFRSPSLQPLDVSLEPPHEEQGARDNQGPNDENGQQEDLIRRRDPHRIKCRR